MAPTGAGAPDADGWHCGRSGKRGGTRQAAFQPAQGAHWISRRQMLWAATTARAFLPTVFECAHASCDRVQVQKIFFDKVVSRPVTLRGKPVHSVAVSVDGEIGFGAQDS